MNVALFSHFVLTRESICSLLSRSRGVQVVLDADSVLDSIDRIAARRPDILLLDCENPNDDLWVVRQLTKIFPLAKIVLLLRVDDSEFELRAIEAGARGCISKKSDLQVLVKALVLVTQGQYWMSHKVASLLAGKLRGAVTPDQDASRELTDREWETLSLLGVGYVNKEIANHLGISENTVKSHLASIYRKLQVTTRLGAVLHYFRRSQQLGKHAEGATVGSSGDFVPITNVDQNVSVKPHVAVVEVPSEPAEPALEARNPAVPLKSKRYQA